MFGYVLLDTDGFERRWSTGISFSDTGWSIDNLTIYKNKVKVLAVLQTTSIMPDVYYNRRIIHLRLLYYAALAYIQEMYIKYTERKTVPSVTLSDAIGQMNGYGYTHHRYLNGKLVSKSKCRYKIL